MEIKPKIILKSLPINMTIKIFANRLGKIVIRYSLITLPNELIKHLMIINLLAMGFDFRSTRRQIDLHFDLVDR